MVGDEEAQGVSFGVFILGCAAALLGFALSGIFLGFNLRYRNERLIKMSSPNLNSVVSAGSILLYVACAVFPMDTFTHTNWASFSCQARGWLLPLGFSLVFGAMLAKAWRVRRIFMKGSIHRVVIRDNILVGIIVAILAVDVTLCGLWQGLDPLHMTIYRGPQSQNDNVTVAVWHCSSKYSAVWISLIMAYKCLLLVYASFLSWAIRGITLPSMNDSTCIIFSAVFTAITGSGVTAVTVMLWPWPNASQTCTVAAIWICTTLILCFVFIPKMLLQWKNQGDIAKLTVIPQIIYSPTQSLEHVEEEVCHLLAENRHLKKSLGEKEGMIQKLQNHVATAKEDLQKLLAEEAKHDSGFEVSSSSSHEHNDSTTRPEQVADQDLKTDGCNAKKPNSVNEMDANKHNITDPQQSDYKAFVHRHYAQAPSWTTLPRYSMRYPGDRTESFKFATQEAKDSLHNISHHLETATHLSTNLRHSINCDINNYDNKLYQCDRDLELHRSKSHDVQWQKPMDPSQQWQPQRCAVHGSNLGNPRNDLGNHLTGSIVQSYDLEDDSDTFSYISSRVGSFGYPSDRESDGPKKCSSCESIYTLENDKYYPSHLVVKKKKRSRRRRMKRWKQPPMPKVYSIQKPLEVAVAARAGLARTKQLMEPPPSNLATFV